VFDQVGFEDGDRVSEETFFALLLDGDLYNDARPNGIDPGAIPNRVLAYMDSAVQQYHLDQITIVGKVYLADILKQLRPHSEMSMMRSQRHRVVYFSILENALGPAAQSRQRAQSQG
jgi:hypothetical protein